MAAKTTQAAGDWGVGATWTGGAVPVSGDTVTINHAVTVSDARTVGHSPGAGDATNAIRCNAAVTIQNGGVLQARGDIGLNNVPFNIEAGGILEFDASAAGAPSTARYVIKGINASDPLAILTITGTSGNHAIVRSNAGGANGRIANNGNDRSGLVDAQYCDFLRVGDASNVLVDPIQSSGDILSFQHCTFDGCGQIGNHFGVGAYDGGAIVRCNDVRTTNSVGSNSAGLSMQARSGTGVKDFIDCDFDKPVAFYNLTGATITGTVFRGLLDFTGGPVAEWDGNLLAIPESDQGDWGSPGTVKNTYVLRIGAPTNQHGMTLTDGVTVGWEDCIFDMPDGLPGAGDCITMSAPSSPQSVYIKRCLVLQTEGGANVGTLVSCLGGPNLTISAIEHNTYHGGQGIYLGETYVGHANMVSSLKSNLAYSESAASAYIISADAGTAQDVVASGNVTHNGVWNPISTDGYDDELTFSSGAPGANDVSGDPQFVDIDRNIKKWDLSLGGAGTVASALSGLYNRTSGYTIAALLTYVRAGFAPTNTAFQAAHDVAVGGWIGAVEGSAGGGAVTGTGALGAQAATVSGSGLGISSGTGALTAQGSTISGSGLSLSSGTGALAAQVGDISGEALSASGGTGVLSAQSADVDGAGVSASSGSGTLAAQASDLTGAGLSLSTGSGALSAQAADVNGDGLSLSTGTGVLDAQDSAVEGSGMVEVEEVTGTGALSAQAATLAGTGLSGSTGSGSLAAQEAVLEALAISASVGTGALIPDAATLDGAGLSMSTGSGVLAAQPSTVSGDGNLEVEEITGTGVLAAQAATLEGIGDVEVEIITGEGELVAQSASVVGVGSWVSVRRLAAGRTATRGGPIQVRQGTRVPKRG